MVDTPLESMLKQLIRTGTKKIKTEPVTPARIKMEPATPSPSGMKKEGPTPKPPVPPKPSTPQPSTSKKKSGGFKKATLSGATKGFLKSIGINSKFIDDDDIEEESPKAAKGKQPKKIRKTEAERLAEGWEEWDKPTKRKLSYGKTKK